MKPGQPLKSIKETYDALAILKELEWLHKRINEVFLRGDIVLDRTLTPAGVTTAQTINKIAGTVNFAAAATSLVVTNSFVDENSIVLCTLMTDDASAVLGSAEPGDGFFTITLSAAPAAETRCGFIVLN